MYARLRERLPTIRAKGGDLVLASDRIHIPLPRAGRWIELIPIELASAQADLWAAGRGRGWEGRDWPSGEGIVGMEWEVLSWAVERVAAQNHSNNNNHATTNT